MEQRSQEILALRTQGMPLNKIALKYDMEIAEVVKLIEAEKRKRRANAYEDRHGGNI